MSNLLFVLGAADPEMQAIESLLKECGVEYVYATGPDGQRVHSGNAYIAEGAITPDGREVSDFTASLVLVECDVGLKQENEETFWLIPSSRIDHHQYGHIGYGKVPEEFLAASSLGQLISLLAAEGKLPETWKPYGTGSRCEPGKIEWSIPDRDDLDKESYWCVCTSDSCWCRIPNCLILVAAADHCLAAAYRGECPGVSPDELMAWRIKSRSEFQRKSCKTCEGEGKVWDGTHGCGQWHDGDDDHPDCYTSNQKFCPDCSEDAILQKVAAARNALTSARSLILSPGIDDSCGRCEGCGVKCAATEDDESWDYCECPATRDMRGIKCPELPEASAREGVCFVADGLADRDGRVKIVCQSGTPEQIRAFMEWAPAQGLVDIYGDPARGFAGGYLV